MNSRQQLLRYCSSLFNLLNRRRRLSPEFAKASPRQLAQALDQDPHRLVDGAPLQCLPHRRSEIGLGQQRWTHSSAGKQKIFTRVSDKTLIILRCRTHRQDPILKNNRSLIYSILYFEHSNWLPKVM